MSFNLENENTQPSIFFSECKAMCHNECKDKVPLPCIPSKDTPGRKREGAIESYISGSGLQVPKIVVSRHISFLICSNFGQHTRKLSVLLKIYVALSFMYFMVRLNDRALCHHVIAKNFLNQIVTGWYKNLKRSLFFLFRPVASKKLRNVV